eukprot:TRINITY_DN18079_c0_g1_i1.p1 TRINITY_DN18079_c0_g1~~TRINITY_DN18079_c0_g1_i1.p1  ORF type:complete len:138 (-),score=22.08 TRINITY_DN18079_c0_g1_i1:45-401(-)
MGRDKHLAKAMYKILISITIIFFVGIDDHQVQAMEENPIMDSFSLLNPWHSFRTLVSKSIDPMESQEKERMTRDVKEENPDCFAIMKNYDNQRLFRFNKAIYNILMLNKNVRCTKSLQ